MQMQMQLQLQKQKQKQNAGVLRCAQNDKQMKEVMDLSKGKSH
jgi:hypothetical protein